MISQYRDRWCLVLIATAVLVLVLASIAAPDGDATDGLADLSSRLPNPRPHPLPVQLADVCGSITTTADSGSPTDYFDAIRPLSVGYLIWSRFPIPIYVEPLTDAHESLVSRWEAAVTVALEDWGQYLPLQRVLTPHQAAIQIHPVMPPLRQTPNGTFRAQSGEARYELYGQAVEDRQVLMHRFEVQVKPGQATQQLEASLRHELGHALGLWGHSRNPDDALYYSQVRTPTPVSPGDILTLCELYQQPTALGWPLKPASP